MKVTYLNEADTHILILPNTGLALQYEIAQGFNHDGSTNGLVGTPPDIEVREGQSALNIVLSEIGGD